MRELHEHGVFDKSKMGRPRIDVDLDEVDSLRSEGLTVSKVAKELGVSKSLLDIRLKERRDAQSQDDDRSQNDNGKITCPHCSSDYVTKEGRNKLRNGYRRKYRCQDCGRIFSLTEVRKRKVTPEIREYIVELNKSKHSPKEICEKVKEKYNVDITRRTVNKYIIYKHRNRVYVDKEEVLSMLREGVPKEEIASKIGVHLATLYNRLNEWELEDPGCYSSIQLTSVSKNRVDVDLNEVDRLKAQGLSYRAISEKLDVSEDTMLNRRKEREELEKSIDPEESLLSDELEKRENGEPEIDAREEEKQEEKEEIILFECPVCGHRGARKDEPVLGKHTYGCQKCKSRFIRLGGKTQWNKERLEFAVKLKEEGLSYAEMADRLKKKYGIFVGKHTPKKWLDFYQRLYKKADSEEQIHVSDKSTHNWSEERKEKHREAMRRYWEKKKAESGSDQEGPVSESVDTKNSADEEGFVSEELHIDPRVAGKRQKRRTKLCQEGREEELRRLEKDDKYIYRLLHEVEAAEDEKKLCPFCKERYIEEPNSDQCEVCESYYSSKNMAEAKLK